MFLNYKIELSTESNQCLCKAGKFGNDVKVEPHVSDIGTFVVKGKGTLIGSCALDCDTGYWECLIGKNTSCINIWIKKYSKNDSLNEVLNNTGEGTWLFDMSKRPLKEGDVVGLYWDQTALPMLSFSLNGEPVPECSINRVRPAVDVYPAVSVDQDASVKIIFNSSHFKFPPKSKKFSMIICATQLI